MNDLVIFETYSFIQNSLINTNVGKKEKNG